MMTTALFGGCSDQQFVSVEMMIGGAGDSRSVLPADVTATFRNHIR
jgi:hypothetical protein